MGYALRSFVHICCLEGVCVYSSLFSFSYSGFFMHLLLNGSLGLNIHLIV